MDVEIHTSDPDNTAPGEIAAWLVKGGWAVLSVSVNEGERTWNLNTGTAEPEEPAARLVPDFVLQLNGEFTGNAYPEQREYEVRLAHDPTDGIQMLVTDSGGAPVAKPLTITEELADGILSMAQTNHDLNGYEDDWTLPTGMGRSLYWVLQTDMDCEVRLDENDLGLIADWLQYATGEKTWDWAERGNEWVAF
jgi:hypothetical protein